MKIKVLVLTQLKVIRKANSLNVRLMSVWLLLRIRLANRAVLAHQVGHQTFLVLKSKQNMIL